MLLLDNVTVEEIKTKKMVEMLKALGADKKALIVITASGYKRVGAAIEESFKAANCEIVFDYFKPDVMVITNLFRDQLDRYGEIDITLDYMKKALDKCSHTELILNAVKTSDKFNLSSLPIDFFNLRIGSITLGASKYISGILFICFCFLQYLRSSLSFIVPRFITLDFIILNMGSDSGILFNFIINSVIPNLLKSLYLIFSYLAQ